MTKIHGIASYKFEYKPYRTTDWILTENIETNERTKDYEYKNLKEDTSYDFRVSVIDKAGNTITSEPQTARTTKVPDTKAPASPTIRLSGTVGNSNWYKSNIIATIVPGKDEDSGIKGIRYRVEGANVIEEEETSTASSKSITISKEGRSTIWAYTVDKAGNISTATTKVVSKDSIAPADVSFTLRTNYNRHNDSFCKSNRCNVRY